MQVHKTIGTFPLIIRPAFTLGGTGGGIAYNMEELKDIVSQGLAASLTSQVTLTPASLCPHSFRRLLHLDIVCSLALPFAVECYCYPRLWNTAEAFYQHG